MLDIPLPERPFDRATSPGPLRTIPGKRMKFRGITVAAKRSKFKFTFGKESKTFSGYDSHEAMLAANQHFPLGAGCWFADNSKTAFKWVEGNFCD